MGDEKASRRFASSDVHIDPSASSQKLGFFHRPLDRLFFGRYQKLVAHFALPEAKASGYSSIMDDGPLACPVYARHKDMDFSPTPPRRAERANPVLKIDVSQPAKSH